MANWTSVAFAMAACTLSAPSLGQDGTPPPPVVVNEARVERLAPVTWYPGTVISRNRARVAAEVDGRLEWVAEVGAALEVGAVIARLDDALLRQELAEAKAQVGRERARLGFLEAEVERLRKLVARNTETQSRYDEAVANLGVTRSELSADQARVALTRERLERTVIKAPFPGVVTERALQAGEWAESGQAVVRIVDSTSLEVQAWVPISALKFVAPGAELTFRANPSEASAPIRTIVPVGDNRSRLYELRLSLRGSRWRGGEDVRVAIPTAAPKQVVAIPRDALVLRRDGTVVYRIKNDTAERISVRTGVAQGGLIEVDAIEPGDQVVVRGGERLRPGAKVTIIPALK